MTDDVVSAEAEQTRSPRPVLRVVAVVCGFAAGIDVWPLLAFERRLSGHLAAIPRTGWLSAALLLVVGCVAAARERRGSWGRRIADQVALLLVGVSVGAVLSRLAPLHPRGPAGTHLDLLLQTPVRLALAAAALLAAAWLMRSGDGLGTAGRPLSLGQAARQTAAAWGALLLAEAVAQPVGQLLALVLTPVHAPGFHVQTQVVVSRGVLGALVLAAAALSAGLARRDVLLLLGAALAASPVLRLLFFFLLQGHHWAVLTRAPQIRISGVIAAAGLAVALLAALAPRRPRVPLTP